MRTHCLPLPTHNYAIVFRRLEYLIRTCYGDRRLAHSFPLSEGILHFVGAKAGEGTRNDWHANAAPSPRKPLSDVGLNLPLSERPGCDHAFRMVSRCNKRTPTGVESVTSLSLLHSFKHPSGWPQDIQKCKVTVRLGGVSKECTPYVKLLVLRFHNESSCSFSLSVRPSSLNPDSLTSFPACRLSSCQKRLLESA